MAWGNSAGDFLTDVCICRIPSVAPTAVAGAIAGPLFNLSIGFGISLCILAHESLVKGIDFEVPGADIRGRAAFILLSFVVVFVLNRVAYNGYQPTKMLGYSLFVLYGISMLGMLLLELLLK